MEYQKSHDLTDEHKFGMAIFWTGMATACVSGIVIAIWWKIEEFRKMFKGPKELSTDYKE